jgi:hypothetical protein
MEGEDGAFLVEAAFLTPIFFFLLFGLLEFGLIFRDYLTVSDSVQAAAKVGSIQGPRESAAGNSADHTMMTSLRQNLANIPIEWIDRIVIFRSNAPGSGGPLAQVPAVCKTALVSQTGARCNIYDPQDAFLAVQNGTADYFKCISSGNVACGWPPQDRKNGPKVFNIEYLGVYVKLDREMVTGVFGDNFEVEIAAVQRLEPGELG